MAYRNQIGPTVQFQSGINSMASGAASGAAAGTMIMPGWGTLAGTIVGTVAGAFSAIVGNNDAEDAARAQLRAAQMANDKNLQELSRQISEVWRERAIEYRRTQSALTYLETEGNTEQAQARNTYAAADQIGSAVTYVTSNTQMQEDAMKWQQMFNLETAIENSNAKVTTLVKQADQSFTGVGIESGKTDWLGVFVTGAVALGNAARGGAFNQSRSSTSKSYQPQTLGGVADYDNTYLTRGLNTYGNYSLPSLSGDSTFKLPSINQSYSSMLRLG